MVEGVEPPLYDNILARLKIYLHRQSDRISEKNLAVLHKQADNDIRDALAPYGYYSPTITETLVKIEGVWQAYYFVDKGKPVIIRNVDVRIVGAGSDNPRLKKLLAQQPLHQGDILQQKMYKDYKKSLIRIAFEEGYLEASFLHHRLDIHRADYFSDITLVLQLGPLYRFGALKSTQQVLDSDLLSRYKPYSSGDPYKAVQLFEYQENLYRSGYFEQVVVRGDISGAEDHNVPIHVDITPLENLNKYTFGLGYATDTGARATFIWDNKLLNSEGHRFKTGLRLGEQESWILANYEIPFNDPRFEKVLFTCLYQNQDWDDTDTTLFSIGPSYVYSKPHMKYSFGLDYRDEQYTVGTTAGHVSLLVPTVSASYILAEDLLTTKNGIQFSGTLKGASEQVFSEESFLQMTVSSKIVVSPFDKWRIISRGLLGATVIDDLEHLPPSLRFYAGGDNSVRGYGYRGIGETDSDGAIIGGLYTVVGSVEIERSLSEYLAGAVFWDVGNATDRIEFEFSQGVGVGGRLNLPFGQVRLDLATAVTESGFPLRLHLSVGGEF